MKKILSLTLAIIVLACAVCVFVPSGTASASETDGIGVWCWRSILNVLPVEYQVYSLDFIALYDGTTYSGVVGYRDSGTEFFCYISDYWHTVYSDSFQEVWRYIQVTSAPSSDTLSLLKSNAVYIGVGASVPASPPAPTTYNVTLSVTNGSAYGDSSLTADQTGNYIIIPNTGYGLPANITVTGATLNSYDPNTGKFSLSNASADVSVSASCPSLPVVTTYSVTFDVSFGRIFGDTSIEQNQTKSYTLVPNNGYGLPETISVTGATLDSYNKSTGVFSVVNPTRNVTVSATCPVLAVDPNSASYNAGYNKGVHDAFSILGDTVLTTNELIGLVSVVGYDSSGNAISGTHWDVDFDYTYNDEQYLQIYNITNASTVDHYVVTLVFSNGKSFVPVTVRSPVGFTSSGNSTAPLKPVSYFGDGLYGSDFTELGSSTDFVVQMPGNQNNIALRLVGSGYGQNLDDVYDKGVKDGFAKGEKVGYDKGKADGARDSKEYTFFNLIAAVIDVPINAILSMFNLEIFGVNLAPLLTAILSLCVVLAIVKMIL